MQIPAPAWRTPEQLGEAVRHLLTKLSELDPSPGENAMKMGQIDKPHWRFRFAGEDFFITTFSPVYKENSSRYAFKARHAFALFQPIKSFGRHGLTEDTPESATNWDDPKTMRDKARVAFKKNGRPYYIPEELPYPVAEHIVKPHDDDGKNCIRWWEPLEKKPKTAK
jgi:FPC/CPF motif-containing protein YcgG